MNGDVVTDFLEPLAKLAFRPKAGEDIAELAAHLARVRPRASAEQLRRAADIVAAGQTTRALPPVGLIVKAIDAAGSREEVGEAVVPARSAVTEAPIVTRWRRTVAAFEAAGEEGRAQIEAQDPGGYERARRGLDAETRLRAERDR